MKRVGNLYNRIVSFENLYSAFRKAYRGASRTQESMSFYFYLERELKGLQKELVEKRYQPGEYRYFKIFEPKERRIAAAPFRDRVVHHALVNVLEGVYEKSFIFDSYATREEKGTHQAILRAQSFFRNNRWYLKGDINKYFESIDHDILMSILERKIKDKDCLFLLEKIIRNGGDDNNKGIPIGNLTSQFLANVYLDPLDHRIKEDYSMKYYLRYMDDFVIFHNVKSTLKDLSHIIESYLRDRLNLQLKASAVVINQRMHGLSFLGARIFPHLLRVKRENLKRSLKKYNSKLHEYRTGKINEEHLKMSLASSYGYFSFFNSRELRKKLLRVDVENAPTA